MDRTRLIEVASGRKAADLCLRNCRLVNVYTREITETSVAIDQGLIVSFGEQEAEIERDLQGRYLIPGLIDSHVHIESSLLSPEQFALLALPHGTTTIVADPHEIANVCGLEGIRYMIEAAEEAPLDVFFMLPSCVPATSFENAGAVLDAEALESMMDHEQVLGLGEMMDYPAVISGDPGALAKLDTAARAGKPIDGHAPMVLGRELMAYRAAGVETDHECSTLEEMAERLSLGMRVLIREGSAARNLATLVKGVTENTAHLCAFCTDDKQPVDLLQEGQIDHNLRLAVQEGLDPITAVELATINAARGYGFKDRGAVAPGLLADLVVLEDLSEFRVREVYKRGVQVAENGSPLFSVGSPDLSRVTGTVNAPTLTKDSFRLSLEQSSVRVIGIEPGSLITRDLVRQVDRDESGCFRATRESDIRKLAVVERHRRTGNIGLGLVEGFGVTGGALATTIAHDSHNLIVLGDNDEDMFLAAEELIRLDGGMSIAGGGALLGSLALPIGGLMTNEPGAKVSAQLEELNALAFDRLGVRRDIDPFMTLSFLALPVIPELKLTDMGLFDVKRFAFTSINA
ncbi:MAG: adenine deaminase [Spirochaetaceae bacterium]